MVSYKIHIKLTASVFILLLTFSPILPVLGISDLEWIDEGVYMLYGVETLQVRRAGRPVRAFSMLNVSIISVDGDVVKIAETMIARGPFFGSPYISFTSLVDARTRKYIESMKDIDIEGSRIIWWIRPSELEEDRRIKGFSIPAAVAHVKHTETIETPLGKIETWYLEEFITRPFPERQYWYDKNTGLLVKYRLLTYYDSILQLVVTYILSDTNVPIGKDPAILTPLRMAEEAAIGGIVGGLTTSLTVKTIAKAVSMPKILTHGISAVVGGLWMPGLVSGGVAAVSAEIASNAGLNTAQSIAVGAVAGTLAGLGSALIMSIIVGASLTPIGWALVAVLLGSALISAVISNMALSTIP